MLKEPRPILFAASTQARWGSVVSVLAGPVGMPLASAALLWAMVRLPVPAADLFPLFIVIEILVYLGVGLVWSFGAAMVASLVALAGFFFSPAPWARLLFPLHGVLAWVVFGLLNDYDRRKRAAWNRSQEEADGLELAISRLQSDIETARGVMEDSRARIGAFDRLQMFTDDLIGPYHRDELLQRAQAGLGTMFPRSRVTAHLYPKPDTPEPGDDCGIRALQWGQPRLLPSRSSGTPSWEPGQFICLPLKGRDSYLGWFGLEAKSPEHPFHIHDLRLASIASDLVSLALGNTERFSQTEALAISDELTGVYTRGYFSERLLEEFSKARHNSRPLSLALLDIDHFKRVNDDHGHHMGDEVLRWLARLITAQGRETDFVARYGGEEFVVLMPSTRGSDALRFTQRLCRSVAATPFRWGQKRIKITLSGGVSSLEPDVPSDEELIRRADEALYDAKNGGRNRVCGYAD